jgi:hypothetical protein
VVVALGAVRGRNSGADTSGRIAGACIAAVIERFLADDRVRTDANSILAGVGLCAVVAIIASRATGEEGIGADTRVGLAYSGSVTLFRISTDDEIASNADTRLAGVSLCAGVIIVASNTVILVGVLAEASGVVAGAREVALVVVRAVERGSTRALSNHTP